MTSGHWDERPAASANGSHGPVCVRARRFYRQPLFAIKPIELLVIHDHTLALKQDADPAITKTTPNIGDILHLLADFRAVRRALSPDRFRVDTDKPAGAALRDVVIPHRTQRCISPLAQCRQLFPRRSFSTTLSSIVSASSRLSLAFSSSKALSRAASETSMPPYLALNL